MTFCFQKNALSRGPVQTFMASVHSTLEQSKTVNNFLNGLHSEYVNKRIRILIFILTQTRLVWS